MCGIAGEVSYSRNLTVRENDFLRMQRVLAPRGPDQQGLYLSGPAALIHRRLAVIDIEGGRQPMRAVEGGREFVIVYNGELYNTDELRRELRRAGQTFETRSDTEVVLRSFIAYGEKCVEKFNGIFAFAVWDAAKERLFAARDPIGVKPFFYAVKNGNFIFGSEIKAILAGGEIAPEADLQSVAEIMLLGPGRTPGCGVFRGIEELKAGERLFFSRDGLKKERYRQLKDADFSDSFEECVEKTRFLVTDAIERQLVSDVPVCTFLSGGLDSSIISSVAGRYLKNAANG